MCQYHTHYQPTSKPSYVGSVVDSIFQFIYESQCSSQSFISDGYSLTVEFARSSSGFDFTQHCP